MDNNECLTPIKINKPGLCRKCGKPLHIADSEQTDTLINENGIPVNMVVSYSKIVGYCTNCRTKYSMTKKGNYFVPNTPFYTNLPQEECVEAKTINGTIKENPFVK